MKPFVPRFSKRKGAAILAIAALVICLPLGLRALTHETVYVDGSLAYYSVDDLFAGSTLVVSGTITGEPDSPPRAACLRGHGDQLHRLHPGGPDRLPGPGGGGHPHRPGLWGHRRQRDGDLHPRAPADGGGRNTSSS